MQMSIDQIIGGPATVRGLLPHVAYPGAT